MSPSHNNKIKCCHTKHDIESSKKKYDTLTLHIITFLYLVSFKRSRKFCSFLLVDKGKLSSVKNNNDESKAKVPKSYWPSYSMNKKSKRALPTGIWVSLSMNAVNKWP